VIIWINGAFGAGKTTLATELARAIEPCIPFDPELAGSLLQRTVPAASSGDFQDLPVWRDTVVSIALNLRRRYQTPLIIPMTLVVPEYRREIFGALSMAGERLFHVFLNVDAATLTKRIVAQVIDPRDPAHDAGVRAWRLGQIQSCLNARASLPPDTLIIDAAALTARQLSETVIASIGASSAINIRSSGASDDSGRAEPNRFFGHRAGASLDGRHGCSPSVSDAFL